MPLELGVANTSDGVWSQLYIKLGSQGKFAVTVRHSIPAVAFNEGADGEDALAAGAGPARAAAPEALFDERFAEKLFGLGAREVVGGPVAVQHRGRAIVLELPGFVPCAGDLLEGGEQLLEDAAGYWSTKAPGTLEPLTRANAVSKLVQ